MTLSNQFFYKYNYIILLLNIFQEIFISFVCHIENKILLPTVDLYYIIIIKTIFVITFYEHNVI